jgi:4-alpha-glucanotransferase
LISGADYDHLSLATYGTHDHQPLRALWEELAAQAANPGGAIPLNEMKLLWRYAGFTGDPPYEFTSKLHDALVRRLMESNSWIAVLLIQDLFARQERFNLPGVATGNWVQRIHLPIHELDKEPASARFREILDAAQRIVGASPRNSRRTLTNRIPN